jgi:hypothetical protein
MISSGSAIACLELEANHLSLHDARGNRHLWAAQGTFFAVLFALQDTACDFLFVCRAIPECQLRGRFCSRSLCSEPLQPLVLPSFLPQPDNVLRFGRALQLPKLQQDKIHLSLGGAHHEKIFPDIYNGSSGCEEPSRASLHTL